MKPLYYFLLLVFWAMLPQLSQSQDFLITDGGVQFTCGGNFYDSGGAGGTYSGPEISSITFCADSQDECIGLNFSSYSIEAGFDVLTFYAGGTNTAPFLASLEGTGTNFSVTSTDFCITVEFFSDGSVNLDGWVAEIVCGACPTCDDGIMNGTENGVDCGGDDCPPCPCADLDIPSIPFTTEGTTCGMGNSFDWNTTCNNFSISGNDVTYQFTAEQDGCMNFSLSELPQTSVGMTVTSGCPDDASSDCLLSLSSFGQDMSGIVVAEAGETYFVTVGSDNFGLPCIDFTLNIDDGCPDLTPADCLGAITVCQEEYEETAAPQGSGAFPGEMPFGSCNASETNSYWYTFTVQESGDLSFVIEPNDDFDDYDWSLFNITDDGCLDIPNNPDMEVSCNSWGDFGINGPTGISTANGGSGNSNGPGNLNGPPFNANLPVEEGETYALVVMNWSNSVVGYGINFGESTASIFDDIAPEILEVNQGCSTTEAEVIFSEPVLCETLIPENFQLTGPGGAVEITSVLASNCSLGAQTSDVATIFFAPLEPGIYTLEGTNEAAVTDPCTNQTIGSIEFEVADGFFVEPVVINSCVPGGGVIDLSNYSGGVEPVSFFIDGIEDSDGVFEGLDQGVYSISVIDGTGCELEFEEEVLVEELTIDFSGDFDVCDLATTINIDAPIGTVSWQLPPGLNLVSDDTDAIVVEAAEAGVYTVEATTATDECDLTESVVVTLADPLTPELEVTNGCAPGEGSIVVSSLSGGLEPFSYELNGDSNADGEFTGLNEGSYTLEISDSGECFWSDEIEVVIEQLEIELGDNLEFCGLNGQVDVTYNMGELSWEGEGLSFVSNANGAVATAEESGTYTVLAQINTEICEASDAIQITLTEPIDFSFESENLSCFESCDGTIHISSTPEELFYSIDGGDTFEPDPNFANLCAGTYHIHVMNEIGCEVLNAVTLTQPDEVIAAFNAGPQPTQIPRSEISFVNLSEGHQFSVWEFGYENQLSTEDNPSFVYPDDVGGVYLVTLTVTNDAGCTDELTRRIVIEDQFQVYIPNAFSPNGDGLNEFFIPEFSTTPGVYELKIFDRWGELVFESENYEQPWLGGMQDGDYYLQPGVYVWTLKAGRSDIDAQDYTGHVTLLR